MRDLLSGLGTRLLWIANTAFYFVCLLLLLGAVTRALEGDPVSLLLFPLFFLLAAGFGKERRLMRQRHLNIRAAARVEAGADYGVFLRSFKTDDKLFAIQAGKRLTFSTLFNPLASDFWRLRLSPEWVVRKRREKMEEVIYFALNYRLPLVAIGRDNISYGITRVETSDADWKHVYEQLVRNSKIIVCIPYPSHGSLWEIEWIGQHARDKTIFLLPPAHAEIEGRQYWEHWSDCRRAFGWLPRMPELGQNWLLFQSPSDPAGFRTWEGSLPNLRRVISGAAFPWTPIRVVWAAIKAVLILAALIIAVILAG